jgi:Transposase, Mutator family
MTEEGSYPLPITRKPSSKIGAPTPVGKVRPVLTVVPRAADADDPRRPDGSSSVIDELVRERARRMLAEALQAEVDAYIAQFRDERDERGRRLVVRNGTHQPREVLTSAGAVEVVAPRVNDRRTDPQTGERCRFASGILPPWCRKTPKITEVLPLLYLHGLSSGGLRAGTRAVPRFHGRAVRPVITRLTETRRRGGFIPAGPTGRDGRYSFPPSAPTSRSGSPRACRVEITVRPARRHMPAAALRSTRQHPDHTYVLGVRQDHRVADEGRFVTIGGGVSVEGLRLRR